ncbi:hypothetical protein N7450_000968 [Penicillium hetheringtonii]|uniref:Aminoglycoside phosphotransferase domain-containing protein n=1 Tax=Penicillium hetheringtonii TaxID=911720 RepID=A0AAD6E398_9EURO|nr:hypothetical protein N7450_000968 [Penicillium hetheringtonii]
MPVPSTDWNSHHEFFRLTSYRFVSDERRQMEMRNVQFDMNNLAKIAATSIGFEGCANVKKLAEGLFNKVFLFTMEDGSEVVGKVPCRNAGRPHFTTASEVASMDFARTVLGTPVPKVLAWSSKASENTVAAEYIIMEKAPGVQLEENDLETPTPCVLTKQDGSKVVNPRFSVGPSTSREQFDGGRMGVDFDRGPWNTVDQYERAVGYREINCVEKMLNLPRSLVGLYGPGTYIRSRSKILAALHNYLQLIPYLLPTDSSISSSFLWHSDLHSQNIFVNPESPWEVLSIIDWQFISLLPLFHCARQPHFLDHGGDPVEGLERPKFPENFDGMSPSEQKDAETLYWQRIASSLYRHLVNLEVPVFYKAMEYRETPLFQALLSAQFLAADGEALFQWNLKQLREEWSTLPSVQAAGNPQFPIHFSEDEIHTIDTDAEGTLRGIEWMEMLDLALGSPGLGDGYVRNDQYDAVKRSLKESKAIIVDQLGCSEEDRLQWDEYWPFDE